MMTTFRRALIATTAVSAVAAAVLAPAAMADDKKSGDKKSGLDAVGLTTKNTLVAFDTKNPGDTREIGAISGLDGDTFLVGIDFRVQDGNLFGVGDQGGIYTIDDDAEATKVRQLTVALEGDNFGVDFNPAANALRITSDTGQNLRQPFATDPAATVVDGPLTNPAVAPATGTVPALGVTGAAYTNNDLAAPTATTLFDLDTALDRISIQSPANAGTLAPTGNLPADVGPNAGFDIYSTLDDGVTVANDAFATVTVDDEQRLFAVDVLTGGAVDNGAFDDNVVDLAVLLDQD